MADECNVDVCPICLDDDNKSNGLTTVKCENGHFMHSGCFSAMACRGLKLSCPICRGAFKCETCGETLRRLICVRCYLDTMIYNPIPQVVMYGPHNHDNHQIGWFSGLFNTNKLSVIMNQHIIWGVILILFISHISPWLPQSRTLGTVIYFVNAVWCFDRIIVELFRQIVDGEGGRRRGMFWRGLMRVAHVLHNMVRLLWILVGLTAVQHGIGI